MQLIALSVLVIAGASAWAFRLDLAGTWKFWVALGVPYGALALLALGRLRQDGRLRDVLRPRWGDLSLGVVTGAILLLGSLAARSTLAPTNTARHLWFLRLYAQVGDAETVQRSLVYTSVLLLIIVAEELVWRGMVLDAAQTRFGPRSGWLVATLAYGVAYVPTVFALADPIAHENPLLVLAALGCGLVWSFTAKMTARLPPVIISHIVFTYFSVVQFRWPGM
ncbi:MAG: CPBP family intramembrane metalloprotease [Myxococcales bacterium]|nr:CPBP family intramembrane metalloprotease [Myxococcales bacterium]